MWQYNYTPSSDELYHYGIPGMRWGQKRAMRSAERDYKRNEKHRIQDQEALNLKGTELGSGRKIARQIVRSHPYSDYAGKRMTTKEAVKQRNADINKDFVNRREQARSSLTATADVGRVFAASFLRSAAVGAAAYKTIKLTKNVKTGYAVLAAGQLVNLNKTVKDAIQTANRVHATKN